MEKDLKAIMVPACTNFATLGPVGRLPLMPGTWGSLAASVVAPWLFMPFSVSFRLLILLVAFVLGGLASSVAARAMDRKDPGPVVIDELVGQWVTYLPFAALGSKYLFYGFLLFRVFDMVKPFPVNWAEERFPEGWGIMADDVLAGIYAAICLAVLRLIGA